LPARRRAGRGRGRGRAATSFAPFRARAGTLGERGCPTTARTAPLASEGSTARPGAWEAHGPAGEFSHRWVIGPRLAGSPQASTHRWENSPTAGLKQPSLAVLGQPNARPAQRRPDAEASELDPPLRVLPGLSSAAVVFPAARPTSDSSLDPPALDPPTDLVFFIRHNADDEGGSDEEGNDSVHSVHSVQRVGVTARPGTGERKRERPPPGAEPTLRGCPTKLAWTPPTG
jgi:hypothetical protein